MGAGDRGGQEAEVGKDVVAGGQAWSEGGTGECRGGDVRGEGR